jgi:2-iminoacetate synthase
MQYKTAAEWKKDVIVRDEIDKYLIDGKDFIDEEKIHAQIANAKNPDPE